MEPEPTFEGGSSFIPGPASTQNSLLKKWFLKYLTSLGWAKLLPYGSTLGLCWVVSYDKLLKMINFTCTVWSGAGRKRTSSENRFLYPGVCLNLFQTGAQWCGSVWIIIRIRDTEILHTDPRKKFLFQLFPQNSSVLKKLKYTVFMLIHLIKGRKEIFNT